LYARDNSASEIHSVRQSSDDHVRCSIQGMGGGRATTGGAITGDAQLRAKERAENFPVAMRLLPGRLRRHLVAVYDVVRVIDDLGDEAAGDRTAQLAAFADDLARVWDGGPPRAEVLRRLVPTVRATGLPRDLFDRMVEANLQDQRVTEYATYADLRRYCTLSADPVGRMVLTVFGVTSPGAGELSDRVCSALQLVEHWQDVAEDRAKGRVYLPKEDMVRYAVSPSDLDGAAATPALRRLMAFQTERAATLLDSGAPLVGLLRGWARLAVAGYVAGGRAAVDALRRSGGEVLAATPRTRKQDVLRHLLPLVLTGAGK
jgi:squalene synthase HpnC